MSTSDKMDIFYVVLNQKIGLFHQLSLDKHQPYLPPNLVDFVQRLSIISIFGKHHWCHGIFNMSNQDTFLAYAIRFIFD